MWGLNLLAGVLAIQPKLSQCQVPSPDARPLNPRVTPSQADEASLGPEYGEPTGDGRIDGGVRIVDLGLNPEVGPTRGSWSRERSEVDD